MKFMCPLLTVKDIDKAKAFYTEVLKQEIATDIGPNVTFGNNDFALQAGFDTLLINQEGFKSTYGGNDHELYFEVDDYDAIEAHLQTFDNIDYVHQTKTYPWGQRVVRIYDVDKHIIEIGENMIVVFHRFVDEGLSMEEISKRTMYPVEAIKGMLQQ
ncbi:catechol 2,3-dioxygenase-like lactoylglutathione lyase family enzyme [Breznakia sp. PF5-3]|uniref:VOC family protein n=1 Tax=unclassified Breznakia TaxID=2623764 RepID=UPI002406BAF6|nr:MULTISPECIES: VOC family protein [unclassified Breznakia]MDL2276740.1 glyoxalase [Breznakia sp. OttesenSCG-928-G09]MDF9825299.1 catechol 2,3-dioxygenase-like lactoylglutathione lyase family enzyme [Breznakia sp. PM6-1]MDF9836218.1 catechol 2,3-dioxygenase-like lactoylglutathione lyase family enzyme [Breznakia sp. PF5-3]MDF9838447.1 catechol 2,3-dioxygenase-like lactoylglutathione lyase family enzyme [Breznakia sp. PFB2-8]MDF9860463.1 catechol 2,3-dioxygenase-like lactoylglutathione lyase fa